MFDTVLCRIDTELCQSELCQLNTHLQVLPLGVTILLLYCVHNISSDSEALLRHAYGRQSGAQAKRFPLNVVRQALETRRLAIMHSLELQTACGVPSPCLWHALKCSALGQ